MNIHPVHALDPAPEFLSRKSAIDPAAPNWERLGFADRMTLLHLQDRRDERPVHHRNRQSE